MKGEFVAKLRKYRSHRRDGVSGYWGGGCKREIREQTALSPPGPGESRISTEYRASLYQQKSTR